MSLLLLLRPRTVAPPATGDVTLSYVGAGAAPSGTGLPATGNLTATPNPPTMADGDLVLVAVGSKPDTAELTVSDAAWTFVGNGAGGTGIQGAGTGAVRESWYSRVKDASWSAMPDFTLDGTGNCLWAHAYVIGADVDATYDVAMTSGVRTTESTAWSVTCDTNPGLAAGDMVLFGGATAASLTASAEAITAPGATFAAATEIGEPKTTRNNDVGGFTAETTVTAGTATGAPTVTATMSAATGATGVSTVVRVRGVPVAAPTAQQYPAAGTVPATTDATGATTARFAAGGTVAATTTTTATTIARLRATGTTAGTTTATGATTARLGAAGTVAGIAGATGTATAIQQATGTTTASTTVTGDADLIIGPRQYDTAGTITVTSDTAGAAELLAPTAAPPTLVDSRSGTATALTATITLPTYLTTDTVVMFVSSNNANAQTFSTNVTATTVASAANRLNAWQIAPTDGAQTTFTLTIGASSVLTWWIGTYRGADPTLSTGAGSNIGNNTTATIEPVAATATVVGDGNELVLSAFSVNSTATWATPGTVYNTTTGNAALLINADTLPSGALTAVPAAADRGLAGTSRNESTATIILTPASSTVVRNRLTNPSFEDTAATSAGWETEKTVLGTPAFTKVTSGAVDGTRVQQMQYAGQTGDSGLFAIYQSPIPATPGETLTFTIWLSGSKTNCSLIVGIEGFGTGQVYISETDTAVTTLTSTMTEYTVSYTVPPDAVAVACYVQANEIVAGTAITAQLDKATLTGVPGVVAPSFATAGTATAASSVTGAAGVAGAVDGTIPVTTGTTGTAGLTATAAGTAAAATTVTGTTTARLRATGTSVATTAVTGAATVILGPQQYPAAGTVQAVSGATGVATVIGGPQQYPTAGTVAATTTATGTVGVRAAATGTLPAITGATGTTGLRAVAAGTVVTATSTATGSTGLRARATGTAVTTTTATTGAAVLLLATGGTITATTTTTGTIRQLLTTTGTIDALVTLTGATEVIPAVVPPGPSGRIITVRLRIPETTSRLRVPETSGRLTTLEAIGATR